VTGRLAEIAIEERFTRNGWTIMRNGAGTDFGVDLAAFMRSDDRFVLPHALSIQVKGTQKARLRDDAALATVRASTLASWLWSSTPTICIVHEVTTGRTWWSTPSVALPDRTPRAARDRTLRLQHRLDSEHDWAYLADAVVEQWSHHHGAGALSDLALVLQALTQIALDTSLWTDAGGYAEAVYHAAAVHAYRTVSSLNGFAGRLGSEAFMSLAATVEDRSGLTYSHHSVRRNDLTLGIVSGVERQPESEYLLDVFGRCGTELAAAVPRLQQLARLPELAVPVDAVQSLNGITQRQLLIIDPERAAHVTSEDFAQSEGRPDTSFTAEPEYDSRVVRPLARPILDAMQRRRRPAAETPPPGTTPSKI
jgi:hypothetical protein